MKRQLRGVKGAAWGPSGTVSQLRRPVREMWGCRVAAPGAIACLGRAVVQVHDVACIKRVHVLFVSRLG
jgi:hypothetical protein